MRDMGRGNGTMNDDRNDAAKPCEAGNVAKPRGLMMRLAAFLRDRKGVAAIEFAFIAPLLLTLYFVTMEVAQAIETNKKVSRIGSMVADLVTQQHSETTKAVIEPIMEIGEAILQPYGRTRPTIEITGIEITKDATPRAVVKWSRKMVNGAFSLGPAKDTETDVPAELKIADTFLVRVSAQLDYRPVIAWTAEQRTNMGLLGAFDNIDMDEVYYLRPRMSNKILCTDC